MLPLVPALIAVLPQCYQVRELYSNAQCCGAAYDSVFGLLAKEEDLTSLANRVSLLEKSSSEAVVPASSGESKRKFSFVNYTAAADDNVLAIGDPSNYENRIYVVAVEELRVELTRYFRQYPTSEFKLGGTKYQLVVRFYPIEVMRLSSFAYALFTGAKGNFVRQSDGTYFILSFTNDEFGAPHLVITATSIIQSFEQQNAVRPLPSVDTANFVTTNSEGVPLTRSAYSFAVNLNAPNVGLIQMDAPFDDFVASLSEFETASGLKPISMASQYLFPFGALWQIVYIRRWGPDSFDALLADRTGALWNGPEVRESLLLLRRLEPFFTQGWYSKSLFSTLWDFGGNLGSFNRNEEAILYFDVSLFPAFVVPVESVRHSVGFGFGQGHDNDALSFNGNVVASTYKTAAEKERDVSVAQIFASTHMGEALDFPANVKSQAQASSAHVQKYAAAKIAVANERAYLDRIVDTQLGYEIATYLIDATARPTTSLDAHTVPLSQMVKTFYETGFIPSPRGADGTYVPTIP